MPAPYGITDTGFNRKPLEAVLTDIQDRHRASFGDGIDVAIATELGQLDGNIASEIAECWEVLEGATKSFDPEGAVGAALVNVASFTGTAKKGSAPSTVPVSVNLNAGVTLPAGTSASVTGRSDIVFTTDEDITNSGGAPANLPGTATCTQDGPIVVVAGTLTVRGSLISGWNSITNPEDATAGRNEDTNIELRQRREDQLALRGGSTARAIAADLLDFDNHPELVGIRTAQVLTNRTDFVDANGLPAHSFEVLIDDGDTPSVADDDIAQSIFDSGPDGIATAGGTVANAVDENGDDQPIRFSRVTLRAVYLTYDLDITDAYPVDGDAQVKAAVLNAGLSVRAGDEVIALKFRAVALSVAGVRDVLDFKIGFTPAPALDVNLVTGVRERATFDSANITITT